jgi:orotate phosphoribosyltransferase
MNGLFGWLNRLKEVWPGGCMTELQDDDADFGSPTAEHDEVVLELMQLLLARSAIRFGKFPLRSGKMSGYYVDAGTLCAGHDMYTVGRALAITIRHHFGEDVDVIFAAGQDALPVAVLATQYYALLVGYPAEWGYVRPLDLNVPPQTLGGFLGENRKAVIIDDVLTSGSSIRCAVDTVRATGATVVGVCTLLDRREREKGKHVSSNLARDLGTKVVTCATIGEISKKLPESAFTPEQRDLLNRGG